MSSFLQSIHSLLGDGEQLRLYCTRKGDELAVVVTPIVSGSKTDNDSDEAVKLRATLAIPLKVTASPTVLEAELPALLTKLEAERSPIKSALQIIDHVRETKKSSAAKAAPAKPSTTKRTTVTDNESDDCAADEGPEAEAGVESGPVASAPLVVSLTNPDSLF